MIVAALALAAIGAAALAGVITFMVFFVLLVPVLFLLLVGALVLGRRRLKVSVVRRSKTVQRSDGGAARSNQDH